MNERDVREANFERHRKSGWGVWILVKEQWVATDGFWKRTAQWTWYNFYGKKILPAGVRENVGAWSWETS